MVAVVLHQDFLMMNGPVLNVKEDQVDNCKNYIVEKCVNRPRIRIMMI